MLPYLASGRFSAQDRLTVAAHAGHVIRLFCNSQARQVAELNYLSVVPEEAMDFAATHLDAIALTARRVLAAMHKGELAMTHDFYLKRYALSNAIVPGDVLLFDEGQDASPAMLEVFLRSPGRKVIVGDRHQQIYGWRHAVNSLETVDFTELPLSASFRFPGEIARVAKTVVGWKPEGERAIQLRGRGRASAAIRTAAVLARTNAGLFEAALAYISSRERVGLEPKIEVAGNLHAMLSADSGGSIYDLVNLKAGKTERVKDEGLRALTTWQECKGFAEESGDPSLRALTRLVDEHGQRLPGMIQRLKRSMDRPGEAAMTFATVHQSKGLEYDAVVVWHDFQGQTSSPTPEEINILYVAVTRARSFLFIPDMVFNATPHEWADRPRVVTPYPVEDRDDIAGLGSTRGVGTDLTLQGLNGLQTTLGATWLRAEIDEPEGRREIEFAPRWTANASAAYTRSDWQFNLQAQAVGPMRLPDVPGFDLHSAPYGLVNGYVGRTFGGRTTVRVGLKNATNTRQPTPLIAADRPFSEDFDASRVYGRIEGRRAFVEVAIQW